ncbi:hypothetical protein BH23CHL5_BH23CHL5_14310 [soil metagenome]
MKHPVHFMAPGDDSLNAGRRVVDCSLTAMYVVETQNLVESGTALPLRAAALADRMMSST